MNAKHREFVEARAREYADAIVTHGHELWRPMMLAYLAGALSEHKRAEELVEALRVIASNGDGRGAGWTPAQHARLAIAEWSEDE